MNGPTISTLLALSFAGLMFGAAAAPAQASVPHYRAQPAAPPAADTLLVRDLVWKCGAAGCVAGKSNSRPATVCAALVREAGAVRSFSAGGRELAADELEKCNARAR